MAPINLPDGSQVSEIVLPDGSTASEVLAPDGSTVFSAIPDSGVSRWTLDDGDTDGNTVIDIWNGNNATNNGATTGASGANQTYSTNEGYDFDPGDKVDLSYPSELQSSSGLTLAIWFKIDTLDTTNDQMLMGDYSDFSNRVQLKVDPGGTLSGDVETDGTRVNVDGGSISVDTWYHAILSFDSGSLTLFVDGSSVDSSTGGPSSTPSSLSDFNIGYNAQQPAELDGTVDDPRTYSKGINSTEASNLYQTGSI